MAKRNKRWDEAYAGREHAWRGNLRLLMVGSSVVAVSVIGLILLKFQPEYLETCLWVLLLLGLLFTSAIAQVMLGERKEHEMWWLNRPYRWWQ